MLKLDDVYANSDYEIKIKVRVFQRVVGVLTGGMAFGVVFIGLVQQHWLEAAIMTVFTAVMATSLALVRRGKYDAASMLVGPTLFLPLYLVNLANGGSREVILLSALEYATISFLPILFARKPIASVGMSAAILLLFLGQIALQQERVATADPTVPVLLASILLLSLILILGISLQSIFHRIRRDNRLQLEAAESSRRSTLDLISQVTVQLEKSGRLTEETSGTAAAGVEIERHVQSINGQIVNLNQRFNNSEAALESIRSNLKQLTAVASTQAEIVAHSGSAVEEMVASIQSVSGIITNRLAEVQVLKKTAQDGKQAIQETSQSFAEVSKQIESIREITSIITGIAAQTNLLAMNAAIEAAHAGNAGRGFSVVASEIRKLAESSSQNSATIGTSLKNLTAAIEKTDKRVLASGAAFDLVRAGIDRVSGAMDEIGASTQELNIGTNEILHSTTDLRGATKAVDESVYAVTVAYEQILSDLKQVSRIIEEVSGGMKEINVGATDIRLSVTNITEMAADLKAQTLRLQSAAGH